jgi:hypothetical protein
MIEYDGMHEADNLFFCRSRSDREPGALREKTAGAGGKREDRL